MPLAVDSPAMAAPGDIFTRILLVMLAIGGLATGCRSTESAAPATSLIGTSWLAKEIDEQRVLERVESTLSFDSAQRITGQAACNRYFGALELGEGTIRLKPAGTTRMACAPAVMDQESRFLAALGAASAFRREAGKLVLLDETGRVRVRLTPRGPAAEQQLRRVNHDGIVHQKDLGQATAQVATEIQSFNPDSTWQRVDQVTPTR